MSYPEVYYVAFAPTGPASFGVIYRIGSKTNKQTIENWAKAHNSHEITAVIPMPSFAAAQKFYEAAKARRERG